MEYFLGNMYGDYFVLPSQLGSSFTSPCQDDAFVIFLRDASVHCSALSVTLANAIPLVLPSESVAAHSTWHLSGKYSQMKPIYSAKGY